MDYIEGAQIELVAKSISGATAEISSTETVLLLAEGFAGLNELRHYSGPAALPANSLILGVVAIPMTTLAGFSTWTVGDLNTPDRFIGPQTNLLADGTAAVGLRHWQIGMQVQLAADRIYVTTDAKPSAGAIKLIVNYLGFAAPGLVTYFRDTFKDADGASLETHTPDVWNDANKLELFNGYGGLAIQANRLVGVAGTVTSTGLMGATVAAHAVDVIETVRFRWDARDAGFWLIGQAKDLGGAHEGRQSGGWQLRLQGGTLALVNYVFGWPTVASAPLVLEDGHEYEVKVFWSDTVIVVFVDGVQKLSFVNTAAHPVGDRFGFDFCPTDGQLPRSSVTEVRLEQVA